MSRLLIVVWLLLPLFSLAQSETYQPKAENPYATPSGSSEQGEYMIVAFPDRLFTCHFGKELVAANDQDFDYIRNFFQQILTDSITQAIGTYKEVVNTNRVTDSHREKSMVQENLSYVYTDIPVKEEELSTTDKFKKKLKLKKEEPKPTKTGTYIEGGQLKTTRSTTPKYMSSQVKNPDFISVLQGIHGQEFIVTVNQVEFVYAVRANQLDLQYERFDRQLNVHYTVFDSKGSVVCGGVATEYLSKDWNQLDEIAAHSFGKIASQITQEIPGLIPDETEE